MRQQGCDGVGGDLRVVAAAVVWWAHGDEPFAQPGGLVEELGFPQQRYRSDVSFCAPASAPVEVGSGR